MDIAFSTSQVEPSERLPAWRDLVNRAFLPLTIAPLLPGEFHGSVNASDWGELRVWRVRASPMSAVRAEHHIRSSGCDDYLLAVHVTGTAVAAQDGRQVTLGPGDFALFDASRPYRVAFRGLGLFEHVIYQLPRVSLDARGRVGGATALRVPAASSAGRLVSPYLQALARPAQAPAQAFIDAGLDLAVTALRAGPGLDQRRLVTGEVKRYALARLADPSLSPQVVARASYISVRQLHRLFAREGTSFGAWILEQRLRRCRTDLADQQLSPLTVAEVAASWGFRSAAYFSRAFHARYGRTPTEVRRASRPSHPEGAAL